MTIVTGAPPWQAIRILGAAFCAAFRATPASGPNDGGGDGHRISSPWDDAAEGWSRHTDLIRQWLTDATAAMLDGAHIASGQRVLDVAAGAGDQTVDIARRVGPSGAVLATDVSARILDLADARFQAEGLIQIRTRQADAQSLKLVNAGFDAAVCRLGLMFCKDPLPALQGIRSALAQGGRFGALVFGAPQANPCITTLMRTACRHAAVAPTDPFTPGTLLSLGRPGLMETLLNQAGFDDIEVRALQAPFRMGGHPGPARTVHYIRRLGRAKRTAAVQRGQYLRIGLPAISERTCLPR